MTLPNVDKIKKAVELADGWTWMGPEGTDRLQPMSQPFLDALAAQLVRQVDVLDGFVVITRSNRTRIWSVKISGIWKEVEGDDRTMNTINAIVNSKVLENDSA